jgi:predicted membrane-bound spermidine synthase
LVPRSFFIFFLVSGFCSLVYQLVWLRIAMAQFGVTTPMVSVVLSVFMAGLAVGSWGAGWLAARHPSAPASLPLRLYAACETWIGLGAAIAPRVLAIGHGQLAQAGTADWGSGSYHAASAAWVTLALLPFCIAMGATFPLALWAIRRAVPLASPGSFSYLYVANVVGAILGTTLSAFVLIEVLGFQGTLGLTAAANAAIAGGALLFSLRVDRQPSGEVPAPVESRPGDGLLLLALFSTGLASMAMEVVWVRQFTAFLGTVVYAFALILTVYLLGTLLGSKLYRSLGARAERWLPGVWAWLGLLSLLPLLAVDPRLPVPRTLLGGELRLLLGIGPFCAALGFLTPLLVDRWSAGEPRRAGLAYGLNVLGCILGPLLAGFLLVPVLGERWALCLLAAGLSAMAWLLAGTARLALQGSLAAGLVVLVFTRDFETLFEKRVVLRDSTATVVATGDGMARKLLVNGVGMTSLTPITKLMVHLPAAALSTPPRRGLVICFGMGTSFRSMLSWRAETVSVELVPSVPKLFGFFHGDAERQLADPLAHVVIDDGRRYLERTRDSFDLVVVDPPPPIEAAGSSLLYSVEFYDAVKRRLRPGGILQAWLPYGDAMNMADPVTVAAVTRALQQRFPYLRVFGSIEGWGVHLLASDAPIEGLTPRLLASRLPPAAAADLLEWGPAATAEAQFAQLLEREVDPAVLAAVRVPAISDDRPINEYFLLRRLGLLRH